MTDRDSPQDQRVKVYITQPTPCPYLPDRDEQRLLIPLSEDMALAQEQASFFTRLGFRRSQNVMYRPNCQACSACISYRILVNDFAPKATQARLHKRNRHFIWEENGLAASARDLYPLFQRYQRNRHGDSDMVHFTEQDFAALLEPAASGNTSFILRDPLTTAVVGAMLTDRTEDGYSAVYSFYDPAQAHRSLGTELILRLIAQARTENLPYIYLGYWVQDCAKMSYKEKFRPAEILLKDGWATL